MSKNEKNGKPTLEESIPPFPTNVGLEYKLSDPTFVDKGWTILPIEKVVQKMNIYRMRPAQPEFNWFKNNKNKILFYDTGEKLAEIEDSGRGQWYYRNSKLALDHYVPEEPNIEQRIVVYSNGQPDEQGRSRPRTVLATFDYLGNGVVFDHAGKIRLKYNQTEGVLLDRSVGPVTHWKWHKLNDPPVLRQEMVETRLEKDPDILKFADKQDMCNKEKNKEMIALEFEHDMKEKNKALAKKFKPCQIRMKALKINENFSLKILDQATCYLTFRDGPTNLKLNIGMILDVKEIVDTDLTEVGRVSNSLDRIPFKTESLAAIQRSVRHAQRVEKTATEREKRFFNPAESFDRLTATISKPLRSQTRRASSSSTSRNSGSNLCRYTKVCCNLYYAT